MTDQNYASMRRAMVESQLRTSDVNDLPIIRAFLAVPRENFLPAERRDAAYIDRPVAIGEGRQINPPLATARLVAASGIVAGENVLLIGAATGYAAAVLAELGAKVTAVEEAPGLFAAAQANLAGMADITVVEGPLAAGAPSGAPYDLLFIDGAVETVPEALTSQLKPGGRAVFAQVEKNLTRLCTGLNSASGFGAQPFADCESIILPGFAAPRSFTF